MTALEFAALLGAKRIGKGKYLARCPSHPDHRPSLSIAEGKKHPVVFHCMSAGCSQEEILSAMGLRWKDILGDRPQMSPELRKRLEDEQTLHALRDLNRALISKAGVYLAGNKYRLDSLRKSIGRKIIVLENKLDSRKRAIREREAKTARFVKRWGWDRLWELYFERNPS